ncbi:hypothetical protein [Kribbella sp. NPDC051718]|uniref:hypothetical protein n=1 Tax=Kribbella sp. NPDC051718 TaxID=3155168 RepID=UPI003449809A
MTDQTFAPKPVVQPVTPVVNYEPGSRLEQLHAEYVEAKALAASAKERADAATDALKLALTEAAPGAGTIQLEGTAGPRLHLAYVETWRFDSTRFKADDPVKYVQYAKKSGSWTLRVAKGKDA